MRSLHEGLVIITLFVHKTYKDNKFKRIYEVCGHVYMFIKDSWLVNGSLYGRT